MESVINAKQELLRDFGIPESTIEEIPWKKFQNEIQMENYCHTVIDRWLSRF